MKEWDFDREDEIKSSFIHHAVPLDQLETLDEKGNIYSIAELMELKDLKEQLDDCD